jgi:hypothetical protein
VRRSGRDGPAPAHCYNLLPDAVDYNQYFQEIIEPTIQELATNPTSRRHAFLACVTTFHAIDYLANSGNTPNTGNLKQRFRRESAEFAVVDRVAHAFKHVTAYPNARANQPLASREVIARPPASWGEGVWGLSRWGDPVGSTTLDQQHGVDLLVTIQAAARFMRAQYSGRADK